MKVAVVWRLLIASVGGFNTMTGTDLLGAAAGGDAALAAPPAAHFFDTSTLRPDETVAVLGQPGVGALASASSGQLNSEAQRGPVQADQKTNRAILLVLALAFAAVMALFASVLGHDRIVQYLSTL